MHINIFIDESKHFESGYLIFGGFCSENTKAFLDRWVGSLKNLIRHPKGREMKSSEKKFGRSYLEDGFFPKDQKYIKSVFGVVGGINYKKDNYLGYCKGLENLIKLLSHSGFLDGYEEIKIFIDQIKLLSDQKTLEKNIKKDLLKIDNRISQVTLIQSKSSPSIQLADLITGLYKNNIRHIKETNLDLIFPNIKKI